MTNDKFRMTKEIRNQKSEAATPPVSTNFLVIDASSFFRHSSFGFRHCTKPKIECGIRNAKCAIRQLTTDD
ncbi:MAG: hypothetical protein DME22_15045 [Verrucomicrobia bacterium]|nr:MAG: hypothetical protein DME22_15045 [Verrucomicrobiota bacterium]PYJ98547.1 MAG: hypothetical protein DME23_11805 [Verrucomicrobiota bacterium]